MTILDVQQLMTDIERTTIGVYYRTAKFRVVSNDPWEDPYRVMCAVHATDPNDADVTNLDPYRTHFRWGPKGAEWTDKAFFVERIAARPEFALPAKNANRYMWLVDVTYVDYKSADEEGMQKDDEELQKTVGSDDDNTQDVKPDVKIEWGGISGEEDVHMGYADDDDADTPVEDPVNPGEPAPPGGTQEAGTSIKYAPMINAAEQPLPPQRIQINDPVLYVHWNHQGSDNASTNLRSAYKDCVNKDQWDDFEPRTVKITHWDVKLLRNNKGWFTRNKMRLVVRRSIEGLSLWDYDFGGYGNVTIASAGAGNPEDRYKVVSGKDVDDAHIPITTVRLEADGKFALVQHQLKKDDLKRNKVFRGRLFATLVANHGFPLELPAKPPPSP